jgi:hypothetical protein
MGFKRKKNVKKLADGGQTGNPFLGVGIQYQPVAADVPSLDAAKITYENYRKNEDYLEQERAKRQVSEEALRARISQYKGSTGGKAALTDLVVGQLRDYNKTAKANDINWLFSSEATEQRDSIIGASLDPSRIQQMENDFNTLTSGYDSMIKNNTLENAQVSNGQIITRNKETGATESVALENFNTKLHDTVSGKQRYEELFNSKNFDASKDSFFTGVINYDNAINNLLETFRTAGGADAVDYGSRQTAGDVQSVVDNKRALAAAKSQAVKNMSNETRSSLQGEYLKRIASTGAKYTQAGFDAYVDGILNLQVEKMRDRKTAYRQYDADALNGKGKQDELTSSDYNGVVREDFDIPFTDTEGIDEGGSIKVVGSSYVQGDKGPVEMLNISGPVYTTGGEDGMFSGTNYTAENGGKAKVLETQLENVYHDGGFLLPITTGTVYDPKGKAIDKVEAGLMIMNGPEGDFKYAGSDIVKGKPMYHMTIDVMGDDGKPAYQRTVNVMELKNGNLVEVKASPFDVYTKKDDRSWFGSGTNAKIMVPMDQKRSVVAFNKNISMQRTDEKYFSGPNRSWPADPNAPGNQALLMIQKGNINLYNYVIGQIAKSRATSGEDRERYIQDVDRHINDAIMEINEASMRSNVSVAKPDFTRKESEASRR